MNKTFGEFKADFDLMYNNINNASAPGFTDEEIWRIAQQSTEEVCQGVYNGTLKGIGFEVSEEVTSYIEGLTKQARFTIEGNYVVKVINDTTEYDDLKSQLYVKDGDNYVSASGDYDPTATYYIKNKLNDNITGTIMEIPQKDFHIVSCEIDDNLWFIVYESVKYKNSDTCLGGTTVGVKPVTHDSVYRIMQNPFVGRNSNYAIRLLRENEVELLSYKEEIDEYLVRYMEKSFFVSKWSYNQNGSRDYNNTHILDNINDSLYRVIVRQTVNNAKQIWAS